MRTIPERLLNRRVNVSRISGGVTISDSGEVRNDPSTLVTNVKMRITANKYFGDNTRPEGWLVTSTHVGFIQYTENVKAGDVITDREDGKIYTVNFVDNMPGGVTDHHKEVFMTHSSYDVS